MTETNLFKATGSKSEHGENSGVNIKKPMGIGATRRDAVLDRKERNERTSSQSSLEGEKASTSSTNTTTPTSPVSTSFPSTQLFGLYYRALVLFLVFALWRSLAFSVAIRTAPSSNPINNAKGVPHSDFHCNSFLCYSASLNIRKPEGLFPLLNAQTTPLISRILKKCREGKNPYIWDNMPNGRRYEVTCSDASIEASTDAKIDGGGPAGLCLARCISDNYSCEGVLYLVDRPFESSCFFQHNSERSAFEASERVLAAKLLKD